MKKIPLAAPSVRIYCVLADILIAGIAAVWLVLAFSWLALAVAGLAAALLIFYNIQVFRSAILVDPEGKAITLKGLQARTDDVSAAARVFTREVSLGAHVSRVIVAADGEGAELSVISTLNNINHGYVTEAAARELADALGVEFQETVAPHLYDRRARRTYEQQRREEARIARRQKRQTPAPEDGTPPASGPVNYDELDDG